jgi:hypothetical protein
VRTIVQPLPHDLAVVDALETIGKPVGFGQAPPAALNSDGLPTQDYIVLYPISGVRDGTLSDPYGDVSLVYQTSIVGRLPDGVRWLAGQIEAALVGITVAGRVVTQIIPEDLGGVLPDRDVGPPHPYYATPRWRLITTPA